MATVAIYSLKGGVGKTTLSVNLAWCAATLSARRTLLWDLDPQAASTWVRVTAPGRSSTEAAPHAAVSAGRRGVGSALRVTCREAVLAQPAAEVTVTL